MRSITSRSNALVARFRDLANHPDVTGARLLLDGPHLVRDAHAAGLTFEHVAVSVSALDRGGDAATLARTLDASGHDVLTVSEPVLRAMSPVKTPTGIVAIAERVVPSGPILLEDQEASFLVLADVQDPGNLGALVRVAEAGGISQVIVCGHSALPFGWRAIRGSMGSVLRMRIARLATIDEALDALSVSRARLIAAVPRGGLPPDAVSWGGRVAMILGGEGAGLSPAQLDRCDAQVTIPMCAPVESLNVGTAGAILIYAARRQRSS